MNEKKIKRIVDKYIDARGILDNLKELLVIYDQSKDAYDLVEGVREIVEDYEE